MDFSLRDEQKALREAMVSFGQKALSADIDPDGPFDRDRWRRCAEHGVLGLMTDPKYKADEKPPVDPVTALIAMEGLGYGCPDNDLPFAVNANIWTIQLAIAEHGNEEQKSLFLPKLASGEWIGAHAMTEPEAGSDAYSMQTTAIACDGGYRINGTKCMISLAPVSDLLILFATVKPNAGRWGMTAFLVPTDSPGLQLSEPTKKMGLKTIPMGSITFKDCFVPENYRLGPEGAGASLSHRGLEFERCGIFSGQLGRMERQLEICVEHARSRKQFDKPIGSFQSVSNRIADMKVRLETSRLLAYKVAWLIANDLPAAAESAMLKLYFSESFLESGIDAMRIFGGHGYLSDTGAERDVRDALGGVLYAGTSDIQRNIIAGMLGVK